MSTTRRDRSLITAWAVGLLVCGVAASLTLVIDRAGPVTEQRVGDQGDSVPPRGVALASAATPRAATVESGAGSVALTTDTATTTETKTAATAGTTANARSSSAAGDAPTVAGVSGARGAAPQHEVATAPTADHQRAPEPRTTPSRDVSVGSESLAAARPAPAIHRTPRATLAARDDEHRRIARERAVASASAAPTGNRGAGVDRAVAVAIADSVARVLERGLADSAYPGAYAVVGTRAGVVAARGVGHLDWNESTVPDGNTIWDLASLTKVIGTTSAMMQLVESGKVDLDAPVQHYLPNWTGAGKERVTVRHLLTHSGGLPAFRTYFRANPTPAQILASVYAEPLDTLPGVRMVYSDLGAILLGQIVERVSGQTLDRYLAAHVFAPLRMRSTGYRPDSTLRARIAPTERDPWRGRLLRGEVHDENAYSLGGVSGHAGLFSTGADLSRFARMYLSGGTLDGVRVFEPATIARFTTLQDSALSNRALGWEKPTGNNSAGHRMSPDAFGHTGFTGTSLWIDPRRDVYVILLTNRVNPTREHSRIGPVRTQLADAVLGALGVSAPPAPVPAP